MVLFRTMVLFPTMVHFPTMVLFRTQVLHRVHDVGTSRAGEIGTMVQTYRELVAWQLAVELRDKTIAFLDTFAVGADRELFDQLRGSVSSPSQNVAEGFGRFEPRDFARFLAIARASLDETDNHLRDLASRRGQAARCGELVHLTARCRTAVVRLRSYLLSPRNPWLDRRSRPKPS